MSLRVVLKFAAAAVLLVLLALLSSTKVDFVYKGF